MLELKTIVAIAATKKQKTVDLLISLLLYLFLLISLYVDRNGCQINLWAETIMPK
jgi:hypothetical protein